MSRAPHTITVLEVFGTVCWHCLLALSVLMQFLLKVAWTRLTDGLTVMIVVQEETHSLLFPRCAAHDQ